jgi:hypothetical protein
MIAMTGETTERVIVVMTSAEMIGVMIDVARMTTAATTTTSRSDPHHHHLKRATLMVRFNQPTLRFHVLVRNLRVLSLRFHPTEQLNHRD